MYSLFLYGMQQRKNACFSIVKVSSNMFIRCQTKFLNAFKKYSDDFRTIHKKIIKKSEILKKK